MSHPSSSISGEFQILRAVNIGLRHELRHSTKKQYNQTLESATQAQHGFDFQPITVGEDTPKEMNQHPLDLPNRILKLELKCCSSSTIYHAIEMYRIPFLSSSFLNSSTNKLHLQNVPCSYLHLLLTPMNTKSF